MTEDNENTAYIIRINRSAEELRGHKCRYRIARDNLVREAEGEFLVSSIPDGTLRISIQHFVPDALSKSGLAIFEIKLTQKDAEKIEPDPASPQGFVCHSM